MQLTNGSSLSGTETQQQQQQLANEGVLIDFGQTSSAAPSSIPALGDEGEGQGSSMFPQDHLGFHGDSGGMGVGEKDDDYHPGQPSVASSTNPFAMEGEEVMGGGAGEFQPDPFAPSSSSSSSSAAVPAGIDLLIRNAPPPPVPRGNGRRREGGRQRGDWRVLLQQQRQHQPFLHRRGRGTAGPPAASGGHRYVPLPPQYQPFR